MSEPLLEAGRPPPALLALGRDEVGLETPSDAAETAASACCAVSPWYTDRAADIAELEAHASEYLARANDWLAAHAEHPWEAPLSGQWQLWLSNLGASPQEAELRPAAGYWAHGFDGPAHGGLTTSTALPKSSSPWVNYFATNWPQHLWALSPSPDARIYEVRTADDWTALVERYPNLVEREPFTASTSVFTIPTPYYVPDWPRVAADWEGVRFTMAGKLRTVNNLLRAVDGYTMLIDETGFEETLWFRWVFDGVDDLGVVPGRPVRNPESYLLRGSQHTWPAQLDAMSREGWKQIEIEDGDPRWGHLKQDERFVLLSNRGR